MVEFVELFGCGGVLGSAVLTMLMGVQFVDGDAG